MNFATRLRIIGFLTLLSACSGAMLQPGRRSERYTGEQVTVVLRADPQGIEEVEIHGLIPSQVLTVSRETISSLPDGGFEVSLQKIAEAMAGAGATEAATRVKNRGIDKIVFDRVGEVALRARLDGNGEQVLILNKAQGREPASISVRDEFLIDRFSPGRF